MRYAVMSGLAFALGVYLGHRLYQIGEWVEDAVWKFWQ